MTQAIEEAAIYVVAFVWIIRMIYKVLIEERCPVCKDGKRHWRK